MNPDQGFSPFRDDAEEKALSRPKIEEAKEKDALSSVDILLCGLLVLSVLSLLLSATMAIGYIFPRDLSLHRPSLTPFIYLAWGVTSLSVLIISVKAINGLSERDKKDRIAKRAAEGGGFEA